MWPAADREWLRAEFEPVPRLDPATSAKNLTEIVERIRVRSQAPILIYNLSSVVPGESVHSYEGSDEILSTRIRRFNLALVEVSQRTGISVIDVDRIVAAAGAERVKLDAIHLNAEGYRLVAEEVVRVLEDVGCLASPEPERCS
jgi:lysophospholipase L1-like esterase